MPVEPTPAAEPTLKDVMDLLAKQSERFDNLEATIADLQSAGEPLTAEQLAELNGMTDAQLAEQGITRADLDAAIAAVGEAAAAVDSPADAAAAAAGKGSEAATTAATVALSTARKALDRVLRFENAQRTELEAAEDREATLAFETLETKLTELSSINASQEVVIHALQSRLRRAGQSAAAPGTETVKLFSAKGDGVGKFETTVTHLLEEGNKVGKPISRSTAILLAIKQEPEAYEVYRNKGRE